MAIIVAVIVTISIILWKRSKLNLSNQCGADLSVAGLPLCEEWEFNHNSVHLREEIGQFIKFNLLHDRIVFYQISAILITFIIAVNYFKLCGD